MMNEHKTVSIADQIFEQLEKEILTGEYERGEVLTEAKLSEKLGVSRTPIREALRRLAQEHIIVETTRGASVIGINKEDMRDMYDIRMRLEGFAAYKAAQNRTDEDVEKLRKILELQEFYTQKHDADNIKNFDTDFHAEMYLCTKSQNLYFTLEPLHKKGIKYRKASVVRTNNAEQSYEEHKAIFEAIAAGDPEAAEAAALTHIKNARDRLFKEEDDQNGIDDSTENN